MAGAEIEVELALEEAKEKLARLSPDQIDQLAYETGALIEDQTKRRISDEKTGPDGTPWAPWSASYAALVAEGADAGARSLLIWHNHLLTSIQNYSTGATAIVGSNLVYARVMQDGAAQGEFGGAIGRTRPTEKQPKSRDYYFPIPWGDIPARPYLGLSADNRIEITDLVVDRLEELLQ